MSSSPIAKTEFRATSRRRSRWSAESGNRIVNSSTNRLKPTIVRRIVICLGSVIAIVLAFYYSLIATAQPLAQDEQAQVEAAINIIETRGFTAEAFYLRKFAVFRGGDNWLNSTVAKENAYAATNFPFAVITLYPDFFTYTYDDTERAAILLHEVKHLEGLDEKGAYSFVWKRKKEIGWTRDKYRGSIAWKEIRKQTREHAPNLFVCEFNEFNDCTE